ncbi:unnamed protein product [Arabis nemorensis]|uniref:Uncharacterized protein n=1 Tax=Arabis nemorensis TaxID=586526 RepID=A0A565BK93_9BRAS|nr:unnamed protein product [Arabis nemorensis]
MKDYASGSSADVFGHRWREAGFMNPETQLYTSGLSGWGTTRWETGSGYYGSSSRDQGYLTPREKRNYLYGSGPSSASATLCRLCGQYGHRTYSCAYATRCQSRNDMTEPAS